MKMYPMKRKSSHFTEKENILFGHRMVMLFHKMVKYFAKASDRTESQNQSPHVQQKRTSSQCNPWNDDYSHNHWIRWG